jgi:hypothetical protein
MNNAIDQKIEVGNWGTVEWGGPTINGKSYFYGEGAEEALLELLEEVRPALYLKVTKGTAGQPVLKVTTEPEDTGTPIPAKFHSEIYPWLADKMMKPFSVGGVNNDGGYIVSNNFAEAVKASGLHVESTFYSITPTL